MSIRTGPLHWAGRSQTRYKPNPILRERRLSSTPRQSLSSVGKTAPNKPFTAPDDATLVQLVECYGYLVLKPNGYLWLSGLVPKPQRQLVAERVRQKLEAGRAGDQLGSALVVR